MKNNVYYIGGSPCSLKTSIAERLSKDFSLKMYNADNHIERYLEIGSKKRNKALKKMRKVSVLEQWFLDLDLQLSNELELYKYSGKVIKGDLKRFYRNKNLVVEGCPLIPDFANNLNIDSCNYIALVASKGFERSAFEKRTYMERYLNLTKDANLALENWLKRDEMIADYYKQECEKYGYKFIEIGSKTNFDDLYSEIVEHFELDINEAIIKEEILKQGHINFFDEDSLKEIEEMAKEIANEMEKSGIQNRRNKEKIM